MKNLRYLLFLLTGLTTIANAQTRETWIPISEQQVSPVGERVIIPKKYKVFRLQGSDFKNLLFTAPDEKTVALKNSPVIIELPMPDGTLEQFSIVYSSAMAPELAAQFPELKTFSAQGITDSTAFGKLDWNDFGFHALIRKTSGDIYIDPYSRNNTTDYISYFALDFEKEAGETAIGSDVIKPDSEKKNESRDVLNGSGDRSGICTGEELRTYRLAIACTGEYAQAATGLSNPNVSQILSAVVTTVNRINAVYETEVAIRFVLVGAEASILFANEMTDPFDGNDDGDILIDESQVVIDDAIGHANYDIGHTFSTGGGGLAYLGCVCESNKASAITGSSNPVGDPYDIDYVAHEMGHQFSGNHTFASETGGCEWNGNPGTQVEPGSGVTIMAYAGLCDFNDLDNHSIPYFHTISFDEIMEFTTSGAGSTCGVVTATGNSAPAVTAPTSYIVPVSTPFILTGSATDADGDALTYQWEETDNGPTGDWNSGDAPYFRSYTPALTQTRMFPKQSVVLTGMYTNTIGEYLPATDQVLNFRLIARDNQLGGGGVCYANTQITVDDSGPFEITYPNTTGISWSGASAHTITWDVNGTNAAPVNCANVNILVSTDGGSTYTMLIANTPNDGSQLINAPLIPVTKTTCRIKVESIGNVFFDVSNKNFTITAGFASVEEFNAANGLVVDVIPNPFNDEMQLSFAGLNENELTTVIVYDLLGNIVLTDTYTGINESIKKYDVSFLSKGAYFIRLSNSEQNAVFKLIRE